MSRVLLVGREEVVGPMVPVQRSIGVEVVGATEVVGMDDVPTSVRSKKDASIVRVRPVRPRRQGRRDGQRREHRRHDGGVAPAHRPHQGRRPSGDRRTDPGAGSSPADPRRRRRHRRLHAGVAGAVRADGPRVRPHPARRRRAARSGCCRTAKKPARATSSARRAYELLADVPGFVGNVEGRDFMRPESRRHRHRRVHGQRRAEDDRRRDRGTSQPRLQRARATPELRARRRGGPAAPARGGRGRRPRLHRGRGAARRARACA